MIPGLLAIFSKKGWMILLWGLLLLPLGFAIQAIGLLQGNALPVWQSALFLVGVLLVAVPDGLEIINLSASVMIATTMIPYGIQLIATAMKADVMKQTERNFWLDISLFITFLSTVFTGIIVWLLIPHQSAAVFLGFNRPFRLTAHIFSGLAGLTGTAIHIIWHRE